MLHSVFFSSVVFLFCIKLYNCNLLVHLPYGKIEGIQLKTDLGKEFYSFQEVPYAQPPIGKLRFMAPQQPSPWEGILSVKNNTKICYQLTSNHEMENEDCLYLNVHTPIKPGVTDHLVPVLIYVHGGGYFEGAGIYSSYPPHLLINQNIVVVTFNYRLGPFGFLSTGDNVMSGNQGLKDQQMVFKWTQRNIKLFGGDPNKVTIYGHSAGASSVAHHLQNRKSEGLFRAAILGSGSSLCPWSYQKQPKTIAIQLAKAIQQNFTNCNESLDLLKFLQSVPAQLIDSAEYRHPVSRIELGLDYGPCFEDSKTNDSIVTKHMHKSLIDGDFIKVPIMIGVTSEESILFIDFKKIDFHMNKFDTHLELIPNHGFNIDPTKREEVGRIIRKFYTDGEFKNNFTATVKILSDKWFKICTTRHAFLHANHEKVYFYKFSHHGNLSPHKTFHEINKAQHGEELNYIWRKEENIDLLENDLKISRSFTTMLANFIKYLNPTPQKSNLLGNITWRSLDHTNQNIMHINDSLKEEKYNGNYWKWLDIFEKYGKEPLINF